MNTLTWGAPTVSGVCQSQDKHYAVLPGHRRDAWCAYRTTQPHAGELGVRPTIEEAKALCEVDAKTARIPPPPPPPERDVRGEPPTQDDLPRGLFWSCMAAIACWAVVAAVLWIHWRNP